MYEIIRFYQNGERELIDTGLTLDEAQAHCNDPETSSSTATGRDAQELSTSYGPWFDGYRSSQGA